MDNTLQIKIHELEAQNHSLREALAQSDQIKELWNQSKEALHHRAYYDELTDIPNRAYFMERLQEIVQAILALADIMHLHVMAEGVNHPQQLEFLLQHGCQEGQGYHFSKPLLAEELETLLDTAVKIRTSVNSKERRE